jgi:hypothetical protein
MMKRILGILFAIIVLVSCNSQKVYSDFDISYSKSGGFAPIYENLLIKGNTAHYSFEGQGKNTGRILKLQTKILKSWTIHFPRIISEEYRKTTRKFMTGLPQQSTSRKVQ